ncbi:MAG: RNA polymerase sigma-70 factor [Bacteroidota bacterium]
MATPNQSTLIEVLFRQYHSELVHFAFRLTNSEEDAKELVQEAFLSAWKMGDQLREDGNPLAYLKRIIRNKYLNNRKHSKLPTVEFEEFSTSNGNHVSNGNHFDYDELQAMIDFEINHLPPKCKAVFELSRKEKLTYKEIAQRQGISVKTVEHQISFALKRLWKAWQDFENGNDGFNCFLKKT